jgi:hypothetical protein
MPYLVNNTLHTPPTHAARTLTATSPSDPLTSPLSPLSPPSHTDPRFAMSAGSGSPNTGSEKSDALLVHRSARASDGNGNANGGGSGGGGGGEQTIVFGAGMQPESTQPPPEMKCAPPAPPPTPPPPIRPQPPPGFFLGNPETLSGEIPRLALPERATHDTPVILPFTSAHSLLDHSDSVEGRHTQPFPSPPRPFFFLLLPNTFLKFRYFLRSYCPRYLTNCKRISLVSS